MSKKPKSSLNELAFSIATEIPLELGSIVKLAEHKKIRDPSKPDDKFAYIYDESTPGFVELSNSKGKVRIRPYELIMALQYMQELPEFHEMLEEDARQLKAMEIMKNKVLSKKQE